MNAAHAPRGRVIAAFAIVYIVWGSTYLFMRFAVETVPPLAMSGVRFFTAGVLLYLIARVRGALTAGDPAWRRHAVVGILLTAGNATISWAVTRVPSGVASLLVAMTPCWMVLFDWLTPHGRRPSMGVIAGVALGLAGTAVLVGPHSMGGTPVDPLGAAVALLGTMSWAAGSIYSRTIPKLSSGLLSSAIQLMSGGAVVLLAGLAAGQLSGFHLSNVSLRSGLSLVYLIVIGSLVAFTAYMYLLSVMSPAVVATYAFVNPVVALLLGAMFAGEALSGRIAAAGVVIVAAVALITLGGPTRSPSPVREAP
jgi:drug/metabolite transporter (DMT)-like permease